MSKVNNRNTRIRSETCSKLPVKMSGRPHSVEFIVKLEHIPHLILVYIINFEQVNVRLKTVSWHSIYTREEWDHPFTVVSVKFEHMAPCSSVSTVDFEHIFIFWVWSFNISIVFRLRWIQVSFMYRKNFYEVKHLHEVACAAPCLTFFRNLFKISKLECVNSPFYEHHL